MFPIKRQKGALKNRGRVTARVLFTKRFRVRAFNEIGSSVPGIPSDAFVIDTPGVHIAPYFILCPPAETTR